MDPVDSLIEEHLDPEVAGRLDGAIRQARSRPVLLLSDAHHDGTFGLLLLTEDGLEFLAADGRIVVEARGDIVLADHRSRGLLAVTFSDGQELTFSDVGDASWTREFARAVNDFANRGAATQLRVAEGATLRTTPPGTPDESRYQGASFVALGLKVFALVAVFVGVILALDGSAAVSDEGGDAAQFLAYSLAGTTLTGLLLAFCGYTLQILIDIAENTSPTRPGAEPKED